MEAVRKPFQGVLNIIRFNWHFYAGALIVAVFLAFIGTRLEEPYRILIYLLCVLISASTIISLLVSLYVYDLSGLYKLDWIKASNSEKLIVNINAGFDETSGVLQHKFKSAELKAFDFYDPEKHTEISIERARKAYPGFPGTIAVHTTTLPLSDMSADTIFVIFAAHEIRDENERIAFFKELQRILKPNGEICVTEHLRDLPNFLAYNIGFLHFYSRNTWIKTFRDADLQLSREFKFNPFISSFSLRKNGNTL